MSNKLDIVKQKSPKKSTKPRISEVVADRSPSNGDLPAKIAEMIGLAGGRNQAAAAMGVSVSTLDNYRQGQTQPRFLELLQLADAAGPSFDSLLAGTSFARQGQSALSERSSSPDAVLLPVYEVRAAAGTGALALHEEIKEHFSVDRNWLAKYVPPNARVGILEGAGDSMSPTIEDGDLLMIVMDDDLLKLPAGGIFVFSLDDQIRLKRLQLLATGDLSIISDNGSYATETIVKDELQFRIRIHGRVFWTGGPLRRRST